MAGLVTYSNTPWGKIPTVNYYADLPADPAPYIGRIFLVLNSSGVWLINYHEKGIYYSDGVNWLKKTGIMDQILNGITYTDIPNGMVLGSNGNHVIAVAAGGGGTPGGSDGQMQYNNGGVFGGDAYSFYDDVNGIHQFGDVVSGNTTEIEADGTLHFLGDATVWKDVIADIMQVGPYFPKYQPGFAEDLNIGYLMFDLNTNPVLEFSIEIPHDYKEHTDALMHIHFCPTTTFEGERCLVQWRVDYYLANVSGQDSGSLTNFETNGRRSCILPFTIRGGTPRWEHLKTIDAEFTTIPSEYLKISNVIKGQIMLEKETDYRDQLAFLYLDLHYECDTVGSREERAKGGLGIGTP